MSQSDIKVYQENLRLKKAFVQLDLDIHPIMNFSPYNLVIENQRLAHLLVFVLKYKECQDRKTMEEMGFHYAPVYPMISPDSDWHRFELWVNGHPVRKKLKDQLPTIIRLKAPDSLSDLELSSELFELLLALNGSGFDVSLNEGIPERLQYQFLWDTLEEVFELDAGGGWFLDGCTGYCPGCFQRPWCETGLSSCWPEDQEAGKMKLPEELDDYLSASPQSLSILQQDQEADNKRLEAYDFPKVEKQISPPGFDIPGLDEASGMDVPINLN